MSFSATNGYLEGRNPIPTSDDEVIATRFALTLATGDLALNTIGAIGVLPPGHLPVALLFDADDLDSNGTPTVAMSIGLLDAAGTALSTATADGGAVWGAGITVGQAGGQVQVLSKALSRVTATQTDRYMGILVSTAAATAVSGQVGVTLLYRPV